jgi:hypothetical protein
MTCHGLPLLDELFALHTQVALLKQDVQGLGLARQVRRGKLCKF